MPHTPGPWYVRAQPVDFSGNGSAFVIFDEAWSRAPVKDSEANARLIAAAPDLLAVAHKARAWIDDYAPSTDLFNALSAAIDKAEGK